MEKVVIIGAGPSGLTAAYELLTQADDYEVIVFEETSYMGGISRTVNYKGNRMDMGGHRFFSKVDEVNRWWEKMLPSQGAPSKDDLMLDRPVHIKEEGPDPENQDRVMLRRNRISRIYFNRKFYDYPVSLKPETLRNMGLLTTMQVGFSYLASAIHKRKENSLEDFYINRFGKKLYSMFFENYTENLWGRHPRDISPEWGAQRVKGLSILAIMKDIFSKIFIPKGRRKVETSLIEEFSYPKYGPGQLWEVTAEEIRKKGGVILTECKVTHVTQNDSHKVTSVTYEKNGEEINLNADIVISSMPLKDLIGGMNNISKEVSDIAYGLPYRDYMTLGVLVPKLNLTNKTKHKTVGNIVPDCWIYVHDKSVKLGRFQIYNNWSPYMVEALDKTVWVGLEYFCNEGDFLWSKTDEEFSAFAVDEMLKMGLIESKADVLDTHTERVKKAYPAYFDTYKDIQIVIDFLNSIDNLYCVGRNGQHRYNNIDHSMCTAFETVKNIRERSVSKDNIWNVNTEKEYHEKNA